MGSPNSCCLFPEKAEAAACSGRLYFSVGAAGAQADFWACLLQSQKQKRHKEKDPKTIAFPLLGQEKKNNANKEPGYFFGFSGSNRGLIFCWGLGSPQINTRSVSGLFSLATPNSPGGIFLRLFVFCSQTDFSDKRKGQKRAEHFCLTCSTNAGQFPKPAAQERDVGGICKKPREATWQLSKDAFSFSTFSVIASCLELLS